MVAAAQANLAAWQQKHPAGATLSAVETEQKADLDARLETLQQSLKDFDDCGPVFDCVVCNDGKVWRAAIDVDESGNLACLSIFNYFLCLAADALTDYRTELKYGCFGKDSMLNYNVNIYDDGAILR